jgi:hypothetical protein
MNFEQALAEVERHVGVPLGNSGRLRLETLFLSLGLDWRPDVVPTPARVAQAWQRVLRADGSMGPPDLAQVYLVGALENFTRFMGRDLDIAFAQVGMRRDFSLLEMMKRRAMRLYTLGRNLSVRDRDAESGAELLRASVDLFDALQDTPAARSDTAQRIVHGMRGVALLMLSRSCADAPALRDAAADLDLAFALGDRSLQNLAYRREAALRLYDCSEDPAALEKLGALLTIPAPRDPQYLSDVAKYHQHRASRALYNGEGDFWVHKDAAVAACDEALSLSALNGEDLRIFNSLRGYAHYLSANASLGMDRDGIFERLTFAIQDFRIAAEAGVGGSCLSRALLRRANLLKRTDLDAAGEDLAEATGSLHLADVATAPAVKVELEASILDLSIQRDMAEGAFGGLAAKCRELLALGEASHHYMLTIVNALRVSWGIADPAAASDTKAASCEVVDLCAKLIQGGAIDEHTALVLGGAADLSSRLDAGDPSDLTLALYRVGLEHRPMPSASLLSHAADAALQAGKARSRAGRAQEALSFYEDAVKRQEAALKVADEDGEATTAGFQRIVAHSKLGEAYLRLRSGSLGSAAVVEGAIHHLEAARALGNETPHLCGLLGDAYYRRGYQRGKREDLERALELKLDAQAKGHKSRENFSLIGRLYHRLFQLDSDPALLARAVQAAIGAWRHRDGAEDRSWPWPLFQLAEFARSPAREAAATRLRSDLQDDPFVTLFRRGDRNALLTAGVEAALRSDEFRRRVIGGRSKVFILEDPHELLATTMVLKPTLEKDAKREKAATAAFFAQLRETGLLGRFSLPAPIAILPSGEPGEVIYAMERARGDGLNKLICGAERRGYQGESAVEVALEYLGHYHAWANGGPTDPRSMNGLAATFSGYVRNLNLDRASATDLQRAFYELTQMKLPFVRKKDAHPENWLVSESGKIVMIDLEASSPCPCLLDVVQLLDDYPVLPADASGWRRRMALCEEYWRSLFGVEPEAGQIQSAYEILAVFRCAFGITYCAREAGKQQASSALEALGLRRDHYLELLHFLEREAHSELSRKAAALVRRGALQAGARARRDSAPPALILAEVGN